MNIEYEVEEDMVGIIDGAKYEMENTEKALEEWHKLKDDFSKEFSEYSPEEPDVDYELAYQHHGFKCLFVYIFNSGFYNQDFIPRILRIIESNGNCFAQFECYDDNEELIGDFQVYIDKVCFDEMLEEAGIVDKLCASRDKGKLIF